ncbi:tRNA (N6-threonylcarbamoyladenosine(37)-N6)-methyltransferase TrmO [Pseudoprimorskyibacter insulae]|uniref:S-adenosyl-L-methionine-binding protein n=1 Tax=Pseudoprimorskyibacter insulae TaxID=1695997 RepID=A0A2R8AQE1_9RHOB|nr:tRNA (N6-threonylcarbamoyladenosine(37)-N6)-methyltransferase TrmO [Pseudoprimorskyibacter insulae]SPF78235.1 S-adenosyl-L-methionine-binding protein [Pseudoprimorskyibacter insulae]
MPQDDIRAGEVAVEAPAPNDAALRFIGRIETPYATRADCPRQGKEGDAICTIILDAPWDKALKGLEKFERADVLYWLDQARRDMVLQSPKDDGNTRGTFSLRSPLRPNPIGLSKVKIDRIEGNRLYVRGLDCVSGTPLLDIKPDICAFAVQARIKDTAH